VAQVDLDSGVDVAANIISLVKKLLSWSFCDRLQKKMRKTSRISVPISFDSPKQLVFQLWPIETIKLKFVVKQFVTKALGHNVRK